MSMKAIQWPANYALVRYKGHAFFYGDVIAIAPDVVNLVRPISKLLIFSVPIVQDTYNNGEPFHVAKFTALQIKP